MSDVAVSFSSMDQMQDVGYSSEKTRTSEPAVNPESWIDQHGDVLYRFAFMRLRDETLAEDMVQETLLSAIQSLKSYAGKSAERTWLTGILKHKIIDHYRKNARQVQITDEDTDLSDVGYFFERQDAWNGHWAIPLRPVDPEQSPDQVLERGEFWGVLNECLSALPQRVANVFTLREIDGMTSEEICGVLSMSANNFWVIMHRARMHLRRCVEVKWFKTV